MKSVRSVPRASHTQAFAEGVPKPENSQKLIRINGLSLNLPCRDSAEMSRFFEPAAGINQSAASGAALRGLGAPGLGGFRPSGREGDGHLLKTHDEVRLAPRQRLVGLKRHVRQPSEQFLEQDPEFQPGQAGAEAVMAPVTTKGHMVIGGSIDLKLFRSMKHALISIAGLIKKQHAIAFLQGLAPKFGSLGHGSIHIFDRRDPSQHFFNGDREFFRLSR